MPQCGMPQSTQNRQPTETATLAANHRADYVGATECRRHGNVPRHDRPAQSPPAGSIKRAETIAANIKNAESACWGRKPNMGIVVQLREKPDQDQGQDQGIPELAEKVAGACRNR